MKHIYLLLFMLIPMTGMAQEGISQDTTPLRQRTQNPD